MLFSQPGANHSFSRVFGSPISSAPGSKACRRRRWGEREVRDVPNVEVFVWSRCCWRKVNNCAWLQFHVLLTTFINSKSIKKWNKNVKVLSMFPSRLRLCMCNMCMFCAPIMFRQAVCDPRYQQCCRIHCWRGVWIVSCMWWKVKHAIYQTVPTHRDLVMLTSSILTHPLVAW